MSTKDIRFKRHCPICQDTLPGTDDAVQVFESLKDQVAEIDNGTADFVEPNCDLCGEDCPLAEARQILAKGEPTLLKADPGEFED